jgi:hypothetical protein
MKAGRILAGLALISVASTASAQPVTQDVTIAVNAISQIAVVGGTQTLTISTAVAGSQPTPAQAATFWAVTTNQVNQKVTAQLDSDFPAGFNVSVELEAPSVGTSAGQRPLTSAAVDVVTGIATLAESALDLTYRLSADASAGVIASTTRTVTYTITTGP